MSGSPGWYRLGRPSSASPAITPAAVIPYKRIFEIYILGLIIRFDRYGRSWKTWPFDRRKTIEKAFSFREEVFTDCGLLIYNDNQEVFSGGSGCACCATVTYGFAKPVSSWGMEPNFGRSNWRFTTN
ncbi:hypothetical protein ACEU2D_23425 [Brevibacillus laterosporus]|uniref:hypothetical protein n=1 Tax=Brevibacillus laterosporus TaxID=1465 RepID=UPI0035A5B1BA